jgi:nicotinate dehydrogenase subunit A
MITLTVNDVRHELDVPDDTALIHVLRDRLGLRGTRQGCGLEQCGSCKVLVDGEPAYSCMAPARSFEGRRIETIEHLARGEGMNAVQRALLAHNAGQCGYCLSGIVIAATALFARDPHPNPAAIRNALDDHLCRCGAQPRVLRALEGLATHG